LSINTNILGTIRPKNNKEPESKILSTTEGGFKLASITFTMHTDARKQIPIIMHRYYCS
jgi:hypothetical protein